MAKAVFYHAGCPVCADAERTILGYLDRSKLNVEIVHLGSDRNRIQEAEQLGVQSVPALFIDDKMYHINCSASLQDLKSGKKEKPARGALSRHPADLFQQPFRNRTKESLNREGELRSDFSDQTRPVHGAHGPGFIVQ